MVVLCCFCFYYSTVSAQVVNVGPNVSNTTDLLDPSAQNWTGNYGTGYWGGSQNPAGVGNESIPNRIPNDSGFIWGGADEIISTTIAINTALTQAGIQVNGFSYKWRVKNGNANIYAQQPGIDDFEITVDILDAQGNVYATYSYDYGYSHNWTTHSGSETFADPFLPPSYFSDVNIYAQGSDSANWAGRYGPEFNVAQSEFTLTFSANPCHNNPLYDPQCQGYAVALFNQQCTLNPLFDPSCQGYAAAYLAQQCAANPLYDTSCPGYATAYYNQQCQADPLYDKNCPGYATAYYNQQCGLDALYDKGCPGYATAYLNQQCSLDPLFDQSCTGYKDAKCNVDPLYDTTCVGYDTAYFNQQCSFDPQFDKNCAGYIAIVDDGIVDPVDDILNFNDVTDVTNVINIPTGIDTGIDNDVSTTIDTPYTETFTVDTGSVPEMQELEINTALQNLEDDIEAEIAQLESESNLGSTVQLDNIDAELAQLNASANNGVTTQEDNIEKELAELENESKEDSDGIDPRGDQFPENDKEKEKEKEKEKQESDEDVELAEDKDKKQKDKKPSKEKNATPGEKDGSIGGKTDQEDDIEKEIAQLKSETKEKTIEKKKDTTSRNDKMRMLIAKKAIELTKKIEEAVTIEQQMLVQRQLLALISFVPGFDYNDKETMDLANFYPPKPVVDHHFSRWFLNDPKFGAMEDLQYK